MSQACTHTHTQIKNTHKNTTLIMIMVQSWFYNNYHKAFDRMSINENVQSLNLVVLFTVTCCKGM